MVGMSRLSVPRGPMSVRRTPWNTETVYHTRSRRAPTPGRMNREVRKSDAACMDLRQLRPLTHSSMFDPGRR
ncbi:hypothetical protein VUR80DRAFT_10205 [Thermomyces stellatus]